MALLITFSPRTSLRVVPQFTPPRWPDTVVILTTTVRPWLGPMGTATAGILTFRTLTALSLKFTWLHIPPSLYGLTRTVTPTPLAAPIVLTLKTWCIPMTLTFCSLTKRWTPVGVEFISAPEDIW